MQNTSSQQVCHNYTQHTTDYQNVRTEHKRLHYYNAI